MKKMKNMIVSALPILLLLGLMNHCTHSTEPKHTGPDTTSQNFTFQTWEFGDGLTSSYFDDAWIFDENNIWVVGYVQQDSFPSNCNIMRWNGQKWSYVKGIGTSSGPSSIWAVDTSEIYFATSAIRTYKNGVFSYVDLSHLTFSSGQSITKLWGSGSNNIWGVGSGGAVVHYDGVSWKKVDVGGENRISDIHGYQSKIYVSWFTSSYQKGGVGELKTNSMVAVYTDGHVNWGASRMYVVTPNLIYSGIYPPWKINLQTQKKTDLFLGELDIQTNSLHANSENDLFMWGLGSGEFSGYLFAHYNGKRLYKKVMEADKTTGWPTKMKWKGNVGVLLSFYKEIGVITIIRRQ